MFFTTTLLSRGSFIGSLINKVRPITAANISNSSPTTVPIKTIEEKIGLPPRPKKPLTPYFRYMQEMRPKLYAENPDFSAMDIVRKLSKTWEAEDPALKQRLLKEYKKDQEIYIEQRTKYDAKLTDEQRAEIKQLKQNILEAKEKRLMRKRLKQLGRPKKPPSAFILFIVSERTNSPQTDKQTYREWHQKVTAKWTRLSDAEKDVYMQEARNEILKYKKELSAWEERMIRLGHIDVVRHGSLVEPPEPKPRKLKQK